VALFAVQRKGTEKVAAAFGPLMILWFGALAAFGLMSISHAVSAPGARSAQRHPLPRESKAGGLLHPLEVILCATGGEALYADMGTSSASTSSTPGTSRRCLRPQCGCCSRSEEQGRPARGYPGVARRGAAAFPLVWLMVPHQAVDIVLKELARVLARGDSWSMEAITVQGNDPPRAGT